MNRERQLSGTNSYRKELRFDLLGFLSERLQENSQVSWLDLACGRGEALIQAAEYFSSKKQTVNLAGIDLVDAFSPTKLPIRFAVGSLHQWQPESCYTLITCVHGLHYVGDKLRVMQTALQALAPGGYFLANLDHRSLLLHRGAKQRFLSRRDLATFGFDYQARHRLVSGGNHSPAPPQWKYLGADDEVGPNYTGQPGVTSHYQCHAGTTRNQ